MFIHHNPIPDRPKRVVLLGGTGFLGKCIASKLIEDGVETLSLGSNDINLLDPFSIDALSKLLKRDDTIIFLSAITPDKGRDVNAFMSNILMMKHLCEVLRNVRIAHLIYFSSDAVYGQKQSFLSEGSQVAPNDLYGAMHLSRELLLSEFVDIPIAILRVTAVYGGEDTHMAYGPNRFLKSAVENQAIHLFGQGEELRDHIYGPDIGTIVSLCAHLKSSGILNVATGVSYAFKRVAELVAAQFNSPIKILQITRSNPIKHKHFDITNLLKAFPFVCLTNLEDGLKLSSNHRLGI